MAFRQFERTSLQLSMGTLLSCLCASVAYADTLAPVKPASVDACVALASNADRLACYDAVFKPSALPVVQAAVVPEPVKKIDKPVVQPETFKEKVVDKVSNIKVIGKAPTLEPTTSLLDQRWELSEKANWVFGIFVLINLFTCYQFSGRAIKMSFQAVPTQIIR